MTRWAGGHTIRELEQVMSLLVRALPLLILFITFRVRRAGRDRAGRPRLHGRGAERARDLRPLGPADGHHRGAAARDRLPDGLRRLYFTVTAITDESYRKEFIGEILEEMRRSLAVPTVYLAALESDSRRGRGST